MQNTVSNQKPLTFQEFQKDAPYVCKGCEDGNKPRPNSSVCMECYRYWKEWKVRRNSQEV